MYLGFFLCFFLLWNPIFSETDTDESNDESKNINSLKYKHEFGFSLNKVWNRSEQNDSWLRENPLNAFLAARTLTTNSIQAYDPRTTLSFTANQVGPNSISLQSANAPCVYNYANFKNDAEFDPFYRFIGNKFYFYANYKVYKQGTKVFCNGAGQTYETNSYIDPLRKLESATVDAGYKIYEKTPETFLVFKMGLKSFQNTLEDSGFIKLNTNFPTFGNAIFQTQYLGPSLGFFLRTPIYKSFDVRVDFSYYFTQGRYSFDLNGANVSGTSWNFSFAENQNDRFSNAVGFWGRSTEINFGYYWNEWIRSFLVFHLETNQFHRDKSVSQMNQYSFSYDTVSQTLSVQNSFLLPCGYAEQQFNFYRIGFGSSVGF